MFDRLLDMKEQACGQALSSFRCTLLNHQFIHTYFFFYVNKSLKSVYHIKKIWTKSHHELFEDSKWSIKKSPFVLRVFK